MGPLGIEKYTMKKTSTLVFHKEGYKLKWMTEELATSVCRGRGTIHVKALHDGNSRSCSQERVMPRWLLQPCPADMSVASSPNQKDCVSDSGQPT